MKSELWFLPKGVKNGSGNSTAVNGARRRRALDGNSGALRYRYKVGSVGRQGLHKFNCR